MHWKYIFDFYGTLADIRTDEEDPKVWEKLGKRYRERGAIYQSLELKREFRRPERRETEKSGGKYAEPDLLKVFTLLSLAGPEAHYCVMERAQDE